MSQAIIQSEPFSIEYLKVHKAQELGQELSKHLGCDKETSAIDCLRKTCPEVWLHATHYFCLPSYEAIWRVYCIAVCIGEVFNLAIWRFDPA
jgi:carboxylesterase type B